MMTEERINYITAEEAAVIAGVSANTIRRAISKGELRWRAARGRGLLLSEAEVKAWKIARKEPPPIVPLDR